MAPSRIVKPPRVVRSPIALECIYSQTVQLTSGSGKTHNYEMVIGEVVNVHIDDAVIVNGMVDMARIKPIARLGYRGDLCGDRPSFRNAARITRGIKAALRALRRMICPAASFLRKDSPK
jgi:flavin reductase (DIM6/NTAB) family NADH-FMN oxidoreductase RutF